MIKNNKLLVNDCDEQRKTPLHWSLHLNWHNISQMLIDFGAPLNAKDDFSRKPYDEAFAMAQINGGVWDESIKRVFDKHHAGTLKRSTAKYDEPLYVKYLTPVEQVKELEEFITRVKDWTTLTKKDADK